MSPSSGRVVHRGSGAVVAETEYGVSEATKGMTKLELREQELKDMEVARRMQEEEMKVRTYIKLPSMTSAKTNVPLYACGDKKVWMLSFKFLDSLKFAFVLRCSSFAIIDKSSLL